MSRSSSLKLSATFVFYLVNFDFGKTFEELLIVLILLKSEFESSSFNDSNTVFILFNFYIICSLLIPFSSYTEFSISFTSFLLNLDLIVVYNFLSISPFLSSELSLTSFSSYWLSIFNGPCFIAKSNRFTIICIFLKLVKMKLIFSLHNLYDLHSLSIVNYDVCYVASYNEMFNKSSSTLDIIILNFSS
jgi:hypothetical protein